MDYPFRSNQCVFLDTNVFTNALKSDAMYNRLCQHIGDREVCTSAYNMHELASAKRRQKEVFELFEDLSVGIAQPSKHLIQNEIKAFNAHTDPIVSQVPLFVTGDYDQIEKLYATSIESVELEFPRGAKKKLIENFWNSRKQPSENMNLHLQTQVQLMAQTRMYVDDPKIWWTEVNNPLVLPSIKARTAIHYYKSHQNHTRKMKLSDVFDVAASASFFYMDEVITEKEMGQQLMRAKKFYGMSLPYSVEFLGTLLR